MEEFNKSVLIIEDQPYQAELLSKIIQDIRPNYFIDDCLTDVPTAINYLMKSEPDLIFMDIELGDKMCFEIFNDLKITTPIIYCTSHYEFALEAFYKNGIHFLTKPTTEARLRAGIEKYEQLEERLSNTQNSKTHNIEYQSRYLLNIGKFTLPIEIDSICYAYLKDKMVHIVTVDNKTYRVDSTLDEFMSSLDPKYFFRINRQYIIHSDIVDKFCSLDAGRIEVRLKKPDIDNQIISFNKRRNFLNWMRGIG